MFEDDRACGIGTLIYSNGDVYEGSWDQDQRHGFGKFVSVHNGQSVMYEGGWKDGIKEGRGKLTFANGDYFEGKWVKGLLDGPVNYIFSNTSPWSDPEY
jgi:hypothetical protein